MAPSQKLESNLVSKNASWLLATHQQTAEISFRGHQQASKRERNVRLRDLDMLLAEGESQHAHLNLRHQNQTPNKKTSQTIASPHLTLSILTFNVSKMLGMLKTVIY